MKFARRVFLFAGIYGLIVLAPLYFLERQIGVQNPPPISHPEFFYGFVGIGLAWQVAFLVIARDPQRYRLLMLPAIVEKLSYSIATFVLFGAGRVGSFAPTTGAIDLALAALFMWSFVATRQTSGATD